MTIDEANKMCREYRGGDLYLSSLTSAKGLMLPEGVGGSLDLYGLTSAEGLVLPREVGGWLYLPGLTSNQIRRIRMPTGMGGRIYRVDL